ncbi:MAG: LCP family protein [Ruminococcus sp.]|nr:LCP family protein [Ruminococcus sp.]
MDDKNKPDDLNEKKEMSVDDIINDVMKKKSAAEKKASGEQQAAPDKQTDDELGVMINADDYLLDFDSDDTFNDTNDDNIENSLDSSFADSAKDGNGEQKSVADLIAEVIQKKTMQEEGEDAGLDQKLDGRVAVSTRQPIEEGDDEYTPESEELEDEPKKKKKLTKKRFTSVIVCYIVGVIFILLSAGVSVFGYYTGLLQRSVNTTGGTGILSIGTADDDDLSREEELREQLKAAQENFVSDDNVTNILIIGEDIRDTENETTGNTDVMMLCSINSETQEVTLTSFMRDMYVEIADTGGTYAKLNAAYSMGGAELTMKTLQNNFGVDVDKYVLFNFYTFIDIVDACGGVDIRISDEEAEGMQDPMAEQNNYLGYETGTDYLTEGGTYHMNGNQALAYARLRYVGNADFERTERQRRVVTKIAEQAQDMSLVELSDLLDTVLRELETNLTDGEIAYLLYHSSALLSYDINQLRIPADGMYTNETIRGSAVLVVDLEASIRLFQETVYGYTSYDDEDDEEDDSSYDYYSSDDDDSSYDYYSNYDDDSSYSYGNQMNTFY